MASFVQLLGLACLTFAAWLVDLRLGVAVAGVCALVVGEALNGVTLPRVTLPKRRGDG